ncbi:MAG: MBL fold metallo-hydrolase [Methanotrichaceae archaeon]
MSTEVILLGTGVGIPHSGRSQAGLVMRMRSEDPLLFDCGAGSLLRLAEAGLSHLDIDTVILTHLHLDHVSDLLPLAKARWLLGESKIQIYGPDGTEEWFRTLQGLYDYLGDLEPSFHLVSPDDKFSIKGFEIEASEAVHSVPALGYKANFGSKTVVYSGDTEPTSSIAELARGSDLLIHECSFPEPYKVTNHTTPKLLGEILQDVTKVILTHLYPETIGHEEEMIKNVKAYLDPEVQVEIGQDLQRIVL